jgi:hypothetical protein
MSEASALARIHYRRLTVVADRVAALQTRRVVTQGSCSLWESTITSSDSLDKPRFAGLHHQPAAAAVLGVRRHREVVDPTTVPVVADHRRRDESIAVEAGQHRRGRSGQRSLRVFARIVPGPDQPGLMPELDSLLESGRR